MSKGNLMLRTRISALCLILVCALLISTGARADGVAVVKACEADTSPPEDTARLTILPNGDTRGSDTAATLVRMARQKAKEGKDAEAIQWAALCNFGDASAQAEVKRDSALVLQYLKQ
jgi:hypothetical protein